MALNLNALLNNLVQNATCWDCLSKTEKKEVEVYFLALALKALGGEDYTNINTLRQGVACYCVPDARLDSFDVVVAQTLCAAVGGPTLTVTAAKAAVTCWCNLEERELHAMEMKLRAHLTAYSA
jgi:hypothetical protein